MIQLPQCLWLWVCNEIRLSYLRLCVKDEWRLSRIKKRKNVLCGAKTVKEKQFKKNAKYAARKRKQIFLQKYTDARNAIFLSSEWQTISTVILAKLYMASDLRPVFPEERLLVEILLDKPPEFLNSSVWANDNRYYVDDKIITLASKYYKKNTPDYICQKLKEYKEQNTYEEFNEVISKLCDEMGVAA